MPNFFLFLFPRQFIKKIIIAVSFVIVTLTLSQTMLIHSSSIFLALGFGIFYFMMYEDYYEHTIDMGLAGLLLICFVFSCNNFNEGINFILIYIGSLAFIQSFRAFTAQEISHNLKNNGDFEENFQQYGWLPSFGLSVIFILCMSFIFESKYIPFLTEAGYGFDMFVTLILPKDEWHIIAFIFFMLFIWFYLNERNNKKESEGKELAYGFGDGDGYIFAAFIALLGIKSFLMILFFNMILLLVLGLPDYLRQKNIKCI